MISISSILIEESVRIRIVRLQDNKQWAVCMVACSTHKLVSVCAVNIIVISIAVMHILTLISASTKNKLRAICLLCLYRASHLIISRHCDVLYILDSFN